MPERDVQAEPVLRLAREDEAPRLIEFINQNFDWKLPLINRPEYFSYYYQGARLQFALAERDGALLAAAGFILANQSPQPDLWLSVWVAARKQNGVGLQLLVALPELTGARLVACNNIRANTMPFYRFLGWTAEALPHYYRLADRPEGGYRLCTPPKNAQRLPVGGDLQLDRVSTTVRLYALGLPPTRHTPRKDLWYLVRRYFAFPHLEYDLWSVHAEGQLLAYLVTRTVNSGEQGEIPVLRLVDFIGEDDLLPRLGRALDELLAATGAEYADCYCAGIPDAVWAAAGFTRRVPGDGAIIPNYLTPPLYENTDYCYMTSDPAGFVMFKADGDQDRPNLPAE